MIAQCHHISASTTNAVEMGFGQALAMAGILAIDHDEIEAVLLDNARQALGNRIAARAAHDIA
jgi:hypothetical protein